MWAMMEKLRMCFKFLARYVAGWSSQCKLRQKHKFAGGSLAAGGFLLRGQKKATKEKAAPMRWFFAAQKTSHAPAKKRGASQLDPAENGVRLDVSCQTVSCIKGWKSKIESDPMFPLRDSDKGSPIAPRFLTSGRQRRRGSRTENDADESS